MAVSQPARQHHLGLKRRLPIEAILITVALLAYFGVRGLTEGAVETAVDNARWLYELEETLRIDWEPELQELITGHQPLIDLFNWIYIYGHWPFIMVVAFWLYFRHTPDYVLYRNAFLISGAMGLIVFALFPVAPPRLADVAVIDTITEHSRAYRVLQPPAFVNQYAAMPSLHFGWNLLLAFAVARVAPHRAVRYAIWIVPIAMAAAVVFTANHFIIDVPAGGAVALAGLVLAIWAQRRLRDREGLRFLVV